jgi:hypothetical protein
MDTKVVQAPAEATHVAFWVYKQPSKDRPKPVEYNTDKTMQVRYQIHPLIGNTETWYIGRIAGMRFDDAMEQILGRYQLPVKRVSQKEILTTEKGNDLRGVATKSD